MLWMLQRRKEKLTAANKTDYSPPKLDEKMAMAMVKMREIEFDFVDDAREYRCEEELCPINEKEFRERYLKNTFDVQFYLNHHDYAGAKVKYGEGGQIGGNKKLILFSRREKERENEERESDDLEERFSRDAVVEAPVSEVVVIEGLEESSNGLTG